VERRQLNLLKLSLVMATPSDPKEAEELTTIMARLEACTARASGARIPRSPTRARTLTPSPR